MKKCRHWSGTGNRKGDTVKKNYKEDFPLLSCRDLAYLDSAATAQRPRRVLEAVKSYYEKENANPLRGFYDLAMESTAAYDRARERVRSFIGAGKTEEIIFTRNTTESINLVAYSYGMENLKAGDEILITVGEHHSNMLPWQLVAERTGAELRYLLCREDGSYPEEEIRKMVTGRTKLAAVGHISNVTGREFPLSVLISLLTHLGIGSCTRASLSFYNTKEDVDRLICSLRSVRRKMGFGA